MKKISDRFLRKIHVTRTAFGLFFTCLLLSVSMVRADGEFRVGAENMKAYLPLLQGKQVALVGNQSSLIGNVHLLDTLQRCGIEVVKIFCPEHGFRGEAEAGAEVKSGVDIKSGVPIVSLYGRNKKPRDKDMKVDVVVFDIQDVGARFYTYISTLHYVMEACAENEVPIIVLDRPNPNGFYVDGPVLDTSLRSFVGMHPVPIVHGMTMGEYARMINGEKWLKDQIRCHLTVIPMSGYYHAMQYSLPIAPSPNLQTDNAVLLYPSLCLFEGTKVSVGRGTTQPFECIGFPGNKTGNFTFKPVSLKGIAVHPPYEHKTCKGTDLKGEGYRLFTAQKLNLQYLITMYQAYPDKKNFFSSFFDKLSGTENLRKQIMDGKTEKEIRESWEPALSQYKVMRKKYLLYPETAEKTVE